MKKAIVMSALCGVYLYGANPNPQSIVNEVANLRQKYEECRQSQNTLTPSDTAVKIKGYQMRIAALENQIQQNNNELQLLKKQTTLSERELSQKRGVIQSLEKSLTLKDQQLRDAIALNERLSKEANAIKVGKIERESLKSALVKAKIDAEKLEKSMGKTDKEVAALQNQLNKANATIAQMQKAPKTPLVQEKIVTKVVEPTEKITALQRELSAAQATIANLKNAPGAKTVVKEKIVEKVVYKERPVVQEKIVEKVVYKDRPVVVEKVVAKPVESSEKLKALQNKLAQNEAQLAKLKAQPQKPTPPKATKLTAVAVPPKVQKVLQTPKTPVAAVSETPKKSAPSAYRMATNAPIYNAPSGRVVDTWEARRSFTSGTASNGWIKITGYFVNRVWQRADEELWVKESDVIRR
ncbi:hypothetical protein [Sulfuricurvum sp.]|uniref:hypothetical protein n=1 Tax=Sulfuricurvum sp. TaxID=2025608 RepID=UPI002E375C19|nr:hypothetical protein [Sulfuricurvum sp.]HEX5329937.1 hypothetical protein [Sulfuricurvum sp.]